jgi:hypothetical protein
MRAIDIRIGDKSQHDEPLFPEFRDGVAGQEAPSEGDLIAVGILEAGMESGAPSLWLVAETEAGDRFSFQMSFGQWDSISGALRGAMARWADRDLEPPKSQDV